MRNLASHRLIAGVLCFVLLFKMLVPAGFMPDMNALQHGVYKITICSADGAKNIWVDKDQQSGDGKAAPAHKTGKMGGAFCPFAGVNASIIPVVALILTMLLLWRRSRYAFAADPLSSFSTTSSWPRAPPALLA